MKYDTDRRQDSRARVDNDNVATRALAVIHILYLFSVSVGNTRFQSALRQYAHTHLTHAKTVRKIEVDRKKFVTITRYMHT